MRSLQAFGIDWRQIQQITSYHRIICDIPIIFQANVKLNYRAEIFYLNMLSKYETKC